MPENATPYETYSMPVGLIFIFNLILGTGALAMPAVFAKAGYLLGVIVIVTLCFTSYLTLTFVVEAMANANAASRIDSMIAMETSSDIIGKSELRMKKENYNNNSKLPSGLSLRQQKKSSTSLEKINDTVNESMGDGTLVLPTGEKFQHEQKMQIALAQVIELKPKFNIVDKFELGAMTEMFFVKWASKLFFLSIILYLYGDLVIYNTVMTKSLRELACTAKLHNCTSSYQLESPCWEGSTLTRRTVYRIFLAGLMLILVPMTYAGIVKTRLIQIITIILRWMAFICMVGICVKIFIHGQNQGHPNVFLLSGIPKMFGVCVYAFMCHHSLPSMITPIEHKAHLYRYIFFDYYLVTICYLMLTLTGIFSFSKLDGVYTLNFQNNQCSTHTNSTNPAIVPVLSYFLPSYPVFTIFSTYTIIALTLVNNFKVLLDEWVDINNPWINHSFPMIAIVPPLIISVFTENVSAIVGFVGSYCGSLIQYVFPCMLAYYSRISIRDKYLQPFIKQSAHMQVTSLKKAEIMQLYWQINPFASPFQSNLWIYVTGVWCVLAVVLVTVDHIVS